MFALNSATRVFLRPGPTDLRKSFDGLYALAEQQLAQDPRGGHLFVFCNRQRNRLKILCWDGSGLWVCAKRLERGRFVWPGDADSDARLSFEQLTLLLQGAQWTPSLRRNRSCR